ncbi:hypothetical protein [Stenotrophomonas acidaminiphila]
MTDANARMWKRYRARVRRHGRCSVCQFRELSDGVFHCRRQPDRQGACDIDGRLPAFRLDDEVLDELRDA